MITTDADIGRQEAECERLRSLAHEAPMNPYRLDADGHRWVEMESYAWRDRSNEWVSACEKLAKMRAALSPKEN